MWREIDKIFVALVFGAIFVFCNVVSAASNDIVINEIGAYEANGHEWIEIWNKGSEPMDISSWKFFEDGTNHNLSASTTDSIIQPDEYAAICQNEEIFFVDNPGFAGSVFDSSWGSLREDGEEIGLKDADDLFVEQFSYVSATEHSLERADPAMSVYDASNWQEHLSGNTLGYVNSNFMAVAPTTTPTTTPEIPTSTPETPTSTPEIPTSTIPIVDTSSIWAQIKINEFVSNPESGNEWLEIFNPSTSSLDLTGGYICDERGATSSYACKTATGTVPAGGWLFVDLFTASYLNNDGDSLFLKNVENEIVDSVAYADDSITEKGQSFARRVDGMDTNSISDWAITTALTPGASNVIVAPIVPSSGGGGSSSGPSNNTEDTAPVVEKPVATTSIVYKGLSLNEIFPNPVGSDAEGEFIEIFNSSSAPIDLTGWKISDGVKTFSASGTIKSKEIKFFARTITKISLNNSSREEVRLIAPDNALADYIYYDSAREGESYSRNASGTWQWSSSSTPGYANYFAPVETGGIIWKISAPLTGQLNEKLIFNAEDSADERGGEINFSWDFGDGTKTIGEEASHAYAVNGAYMVKIIASSTAGSYATKNLNILIGKASAVSDNKIILSEILVNPEGEDGREFIEIKNDGDLPVDLGGWVIANLKKEFAVPSSTIIRPDQRLVFYKAASGLSLNNSEEKIILKNADGRVADMVKLVGIKEGESFALIDNQWQITNQITPGQENIIGVVVEKVSVASAKSKTVYRVMSIAEAREAEKDDGVIIRGTVVVLPGIFGVQYFYIFDGFDGIQIYNSKKDFLKFKVGDNVEIIGVVGEASGIKRIRAKDKSAMDILSTDSVLEPIEKSLDEINEDDAGRLVIIEGDITEIKTNYMYLDNGLGEIKIVFKKGAGINKGAHVEGEHVRAVGIVEAGSDGAQIWPRSNADIIGVSSTKQVAGEKITSETENKAPKAPLFAFLGLTAAVILGFVVKNYGANFIAKLKK